MKVAHVIPEPTLFGPVIQRIADGLGQECIFYRLGRNPWANARDAMRLLSLCRARPDTVFVFHWVPHYRIALLSLLLRRFQYCLLYWGDDYYSTFLDEIRFEQHCIRKSPLLDPKYYRRPRSRLFQWRNALRRLVGLRVVARAVAVLSLTPKHFRLIRFYHYRIFRSAMTTPRILARGYSQEPEIAPAAAACARGENEITVLVCHSATPGVAPGQSLELLRRYQQKWQARIHVRGFISYSGGDESARDALENSLRQQAAFAASVDFERRFIEPALLQERLRAVDVAVFSCLRDEGVSLLTLFVKMGGVVAFNRFSFNHDFFASMYGGKLLAHEQFLALSPLRLQAMRAEAVERAPAVLGYGEIAALPGRRRLPQVDTGNTNP